MANDKLNIKAWDDMMARVAGMPEIERLRAENAAMRSHIANLLEIADLALFYAPGEIGENFELANGMVTQARAFLAAHPAQEGGE